MTPIAVIFGARGGIGSATRESFLAAGYRVVPVTSSSVDFTSDDCYEKVSTILTVNPDVIVNCVGHLDSANQETHNKTFDINVGSNWAILRHYINNPSDKPVKIIMVGSSAYKSGRRSYILYSASKAALYNVWRGACDYFAGTNTSVALINPVRTRTPMIDMSTAAFCYEPEDVAHEILSMAKTPGKQLVEMTYPEEN
jgi:NAD(P)-dependent dehydrogenase (short-subunit alcohol dehydrogenase family)